MNQQELYSALRELVGNPDSNEVSNRQLDRHLIPALNWLVSLLKYTVVDTRVFPIVSDQGSYVVPSDLAWVISVDWNQQRLEPLTTYRLDREYTSWKYQSSANPVNYALDTRGRMLILSPPPSTAAVGLDAFLRLIYISATPGLDSTGTPQLSDLDQELVVYRAAQRYLRSHINPENAQNYMLKIGEYQKELDELLPSAKDRANAPVETYFPTMAVENGRQGAAR